MEPQRILKSLLCKYSDCQSYSDYGIIVGGKAGRSGNTVEFRTFFCKPNKFRFEFKDVHFGLAGAIWSDGSSAFQDLRFVDESHKAPRELDSLEAELSQTRGIIQGPVTTIPPLLLALREQRSLLELHDFKILGEDEVDGQECYHLIGSFRMPKDIELWITKTDCNLKQGCQRAMFPSIKKAAEDKLFLKTQAESDKAFLHAVGPTALLFMPDRWWRSMAMIKPWRSSRVNEFSWTYTNHTFDAEIADSNFVLALNDDDRERT